MKTIMFIILFSDHKLLADQGNSWHNMMMGGNYMMYGGGWFMWLLTIIILGLIVYFIMQQSGKKSSIEETALDILKKRYAKGEISKDEFDKMKKELQR